MDDARLIVWEMLFRRALEIIDSVEKSGHALDDWSFGGGTVLMRKYQHRFSKDIDIFIPDPQYLGHLTPRLNDIAQSQANGYVEQANTLKLYCKEGEIDFIVSSALTPTPYIDEVIFEHQVQVETSAEIIAKKVWHRGADFKARDIFDLSLVIEKESERLLKLGDIFSAKKDVILKRIEDNDKALREDFIQLDTLNYTPTFDHSVRTVKTFFGHFP